MGDVIYGQPLGEDNGKVKMAKANSTSPAAWETQNSFIFSNSSKKNCIDNT